MKKESRDKEISRKSLETFTGDLAKETSSPGGGSAAAVSGASGTALLLMVTRFSDVPGDIFPEDRENKLEKSRKHFLDLATRDRKAYRAYRDVLEENESGDHLREHRRAITLIPLQIAETTAEVTRTFDHIYSHIKNTFRTDRDAGLRSLANAARTAIDLTRCNLAELEHREDVEKIQERLEQAIEDGYDQLLERMPEPLQ